MDEKGARADGVRDGNDVVRWRPMIRVSTGAGTWAGQTDDGPWVVGEPGGQVVATGSPVGAIALLPLLERSMADVAGELGVNDLGGHEMGLEHVLESALGLDGSGYWAACAIDWLEAGFPAAGCRDGLGRAVSDKRVPQRARQVAARILTREFAAPPSHLDS